MKNTSQKLAAVAFALCAAASPALAGRGGDVGLIKTAVASGSVDAIVAEVERAEKLMCEECLDTMIALTEHSRFEVREVAAWWFAKRPAMKKMLAEQFDGELLTAGTLAVRNAADFLGATRTYTALPKLNAAIRRDVGADAKLAIVRAVAGLQGQHGHHRPGAAAQAKRPGAYTPGDDDGDQQLLRRAAGIHGMHPPGFRSVPLLRNTVFHRRVSFCRKRLVHQNARTAARDAPLNSWPRRCSPMTTAAP